MYFAHFAAPIETDISHSYTKQC